MNIEADITEKSKSIGIIGITLFDGPPGVNPVHTVKGNLLTTAWRQGLIRRMLGTSATLTEGQITHFAFGTSDTGPLAADTYLGKEFQRKVMAPGDAVASGDHFLGTVAISFNDLVTAKTTITTLTDSTHLIVPSTAGFRVGDYIEVNPVDTTNVVTNAQYVTIAAIPNGTNLTISALNLGAAVPPVAGWYVMQLIQEVGVLQDRFSTTVATAASSTGFTLTSATGFAIGDQIRVQTGVGAYDYAYSVITNLVGVTVTCSPALPGTPTVGYTVDNGDLADHAPDFLFRKTAAQSAIANVDILIG